MANVRATTSIATRHTRMKPTGSVTSLARRRNASYQGCARKPVLGIASADMTVFDHVAQLAAQLIEFDVFGQLRVARPRKWHDHVLNDRAGALGNNQDAVGQQHGLADVVCDEKRGPRLL